MHTIIKICGITTPEDAALAADCGADMIGLIFAPASKRCLQTRQAETIVAAMADKQIATVGVFTTQNASEILEICQTLNLDFAQLHGTQSRAALPPLQTKTKIIFAQAADESTDPPSKSTTCDYLLFDHKQPGSGVAFDLSSFTPPSRPWILAGGLHPGNVTAAIQSTQPTGVDVCTGVCLADGIRKDPAKIRDFINAVRCANPSQNRILS